MLTKSQVERLVVAAEKFSELPKSIDHLARCVRLIAHGETQPSGLELVSMSIAKLNEDSLARSLDGLATTIERAADEVATALAKP